EENLRKVARVRGEDVDDLMVVILDRPRHTELISRVRKVGARITLIPDGDVAGAIMTAMPGSKVDLLLGIGGTPEGVLAACAMRCLGGNIQGKLYARNEEERRLGEELGYDFNKVLTLEDLVSSEDVFFAATGITDGEFLKGVDYFADGATTESVIMRGLTGTSRRIIATHRLTKLSKISQIPY
ncbi:MAG: fructose-bisphosphatase class II, partial [Bellilinea sp.]